jgi:hypothetical protein
MGVVGSRHGENALFRSLAAFVSSPRAHTGTPSNFDNPHHHFGARRFDPVLCRYIPVGLLEVVPQVMSWRPPAYSTRSQLEGLLSSEAAADWVKISEMFLGPAPSGFTFVPKHKTNAYTLTADALDQLAGAAGKGALPVEEEEGEENG